MSLGYLVRYAVSYTLSRRRSVVVFLVLLLLLMTFCGVLLQASRLIQDATVRAVQRYYPDIILLGYFPQDVMGAIKGFEEVGSVACIKTVRVVVESGRGAWPALLVYGSSLYDGGLLAVAYTARPKGFEVLVTVSDAFRLGVRTGDIVRICHEGVCAEVRIAGYYKSFTPMGYGLVLLGTEALASKLNASSCNVLAVSVKEGVNVEEFAGRLVRAVRESGGVVQSYHVIAKNAEALSKIAAIRGMTLSVTSSLALAIVLMVLVSAALSVIGLERESAIIGVLKAVGMTFRQVVLVYSLGRILIVVVSALAAICLTPILGYSLAVMLLNHMGLEASLIKPFVKLVAYPDLAAYEAALFIPIPVTLLLIPGIIAGKVSIVRALNPYLSHDKYSAGRSSPKLLSWSPWLTLLARRPGRAAVYAAMLALLVAPIVAVGMLDAVYAARIRYASTVNFDTLVYTSPHYYRVLHEALHGAQVLALNVTWAVVNGHGIVVNYVERPKLLSLAAPLLSGRYPQSPNEAVVTLTVAKLLGLKVGDQVEIGGERYKIVGIVQYYYENGLDIFIYGPGRGQKLICYIKGMKPSEVREVLKKFKIPASIASAKAYSTSIASGTSFVLGTVSAPLLLAHLILLAGLLLTLAADLTVNTHQIVLLKCIGARSRDIASWIVKAILPLLPISIPISLATGHILANFIAASLAQSFAYDPPRLNATTLISELALTLPATFAAIYTVAIIAAKRVKANNITLITL